MPGFTVHFQFFFSHFPLGKLATSSIRVNTLMNYTAAIANPFPLFKTNVLSGSQLYE